MSTIYEDDILFRGGGAALTGFNGVDFKRYRLDGSEPEAGTHTRADASTLVTYTDRDGYLRLAAANKRRVDWSAGTSLPSIWAERTRTNVVLHNRDGTQAAWTKTNVTATKDATGVDGVASSATRLAATAGNGTCLQAITLASSARYQSAYVKRVVGSGTVNMTMDNGSTWTVIALTTSWTRVTIPTQTLANPTVGFRIVTSGDEIAFDYVQNEGGIYPTTAILTGAASGVAAVDALSYPIGFGPQSLTIYGKVPRMPYADTSGTISTPSLVRVGSGSALIEILCNGSTRQWDANIHDGSLTRTASGAFPAGSALEVLAQFSALDTGGTVAIDVGSGLGSFSSAAAALPRWGTNNLYLGGSSAAGNEFDGGINKLLVVRDLHTLAECQAVTW